MGAPASRGADSLHELGHELVGVCLRVGGRGVIYGWSAGRVRATAHAQPTTPRAAWARSGQDQGRCTPENRHLLANTHSLGPLADGEDQGFGVHGGVGAVRLVGERLQ